MSTANPQSALLDRMTEALQRISRFVEIDQGGTQSRYGYPETVYDEQGRAMYLRVRVKAAKDLPLTQGQREPGDFPDLSDLGANVLFYIPSPELAEGRPSYAYLVQRASAKAKLAGAAILAPIPYKTMSEKVSLLVAANKAVSIIPEPDVSIGELALFAIRLRRNLRLYMHRSVRVQVFLEFNRYGLPIRPNDSVLSLRRRLGLS